MRNVVVAVAVIALASAIYLRSRGSATAEDPSVDEIGAPEVDARPRSVAFYLIDTCRHDRVGYAGYERKTTPFLEWLAERSVTFETCYSQAPWTKPSMASMLSSRYPSATGVYKMDHRLPEEATTWPETLQANGLYTAGFSANIVMGNILSNFAQGFDHFIESSEINRADPIRFASGSARKLNEHAFAWLDETDHWPMLLYMHSVDPHEEYEPEAEYLARFADPTRHDRFREEWQKLLKSRPPIPGLYVTQDNFDRTGVDAASFIEHGSDLYDADLAANDDQLQRLWDKLQEDGWGEDMVFVFTSDHGEEFFEHGGTSHGYSLYDEMIRVPLMIYAPGLLPGGVKINTPVRLLDVYPTLCELLDIEVPAGLDGQSLVPLIHGGAVPAGRAIYSEHREDPGARMLGQGSGVLYSVRRGGWKFIQNELSSQLIEKPEVELYDLNQDPSEQQNVAGEHPEVVAEFQLEVAAYVEAREASRLLARSGAVTGAARDQLEQLGYGGGDDEALPIWEAMATGDANEVKLSLESGADANQLEPTFGSSPLSTAALYGNVPLAKVLIEGGAEVDARNRDGSTPLISAAFLGRTEAVEFLLAKGADRTLKNLNGDTAEVAARVPWNVTEMIAGLLQMKLDRTEVEAGRARCIELLTVD